MKSPGTILASSTLFCSYLARNQIIVTPLHTNPFLFIGVASTATADFSQDNINGIQANGVEGKLLGNNNFIFFWDDGNFRKMVLTDNKGTLLSGGYVYRQLKPPSTWKDHTTWASGGYSISNFKGV